MYQLTAQQQEQGRTGGKRRVHSWAKFPRAFFQTYSQQNMDRYGHVGLYVAIFGQIGTECLDVGVLPVPR